MKRNAIERTALEIRQPLTQAFAHLSPNLSRIRKAWSGLLERHEPCGKYATLLAGLHLATRVRDLASSNPRAYRQEAEEQGQELARRGVPAECVAAAIALYVECCLPCLLSADRKGIRWTRALARWASIYQFFLLGGYATHAATEREELEEKAALAERRAQDFSVKIADAYEKERRRLAQDLHDEIGHDLIVLKLYTQVIALDLKKGEIGQVRHKLRESVSLIKHALQGVRHLTFDLGPAIWNEQGFIPAIRLYAHQFNVRTGLKVSVRLSGLKVKLPDRYETALYKMLQGALSNIAAHADAQRVGITIESRREQVMMRVEDDGKGFHVGRKLSAPPKSYGLRAMRDRIELLGGTIHFLSHPARGRSTRRGTTIEFHLPLHESEAT
jgi:signal transduction histidine kinase